MPFSYFAMSFVKRSRSAGMSIAIRKARSKNVEIAGAGEVLVRVHCLAICRTDLHVIEGNLKPVMLPIIPGHQVVGTVLALGPGCWCLERGDRVGIAWLRSTCGVCEFCTSGRENLCADSLYTGYSQNGGFAELAVVREDFAYLLPAVIDDAHVAPLLCAGIIGYRALAAAPIFAREGLSASLALVNQRT